MKELLGKFTGGIGITLPHKKCGLKLPEKA
jgi:hypothetical protein